MKPPLQRGGGGAGGRDHNYDCRLWHSSASMSVGTTEAYFMTPFCWTIYIYTP